MTYLFYARPASTTLVIGSAPDVANLGAKLNQAPVLMLSIAVVL